MAQIVRIPACERCRKSKVRCDSATPKCLACTKAITACIIVDTFTRERYSRDQLHTLQRKLASLEARQAQPHRLSVGTESASTWRGRAKTHFVGDGSGLDMFQRVSSNTETTEMQDRVLEQLNLQSPRYELTVPGHDLPSIDLAQTLVQNYFSHSHLLHPFLTRISTLKMLERVYGDESAVCASMEDHYRVFMISAISSITLYRKGHIAEHPYGFFRSAQQFAPKVSMTGSIQGIQNLMLIARFAMYQHIECSIWDITRLCMRQCIDLGLHQRPSKHLPAMEEQLRRNIFWDCYVHDRYSSGILGRPYAIAEQDIEVDSPLEASEDEILQSQCNQLNDIDVTNLVRPNEGSIMPCVVRLRRITTRIQIRFFSSSSSLQTQARTVSTAGKVQADMYDFLDELDHCRNSASIFPQPKSLYERPEWYDFLVEKDKLFLFRGVIANLPINALHPPQWVLSMCLNCAIRVIELYAGMFAHGFITWTRSYFQILFTTGLSLMYCMSILRKPLESSDSSALERASNALRTCSDLLSRFVSEMSDAGRFAAVFEVLSKQHIASQQPANNNSMSQAHDELDTAGQHSVTSNPASRSLNSATNPSEENYGYEFDPSLFELGFEEFGDWSLYPTNTDNVLGQMEAGLGEYAWGAQGDSSNWEQYFSSR